MSNYKSLEEMYKDFVKRATAATKEVVPPIITEAHKEAIVIEVYGRYEPTMYNGTNSFLDRRYGDNGLIDENNFEFEFDEFSDKLIITLYNETRGNQYAPNSQSNMYIDSIIVTGDGYSWKNSGIIGIERDFYKVTEKLLNEPKYKNQIKDKLNKKGIIVW